MVGMIFLPAVCLRHAAPQGRAGQEG
jgi:hypothetical protein